MDYGDQFNQKKQELNYDELVEQVIEEIKALPACDSKYSSQSHNYWEEMVYQARVEKSYSSGVVIALCQGVVGKMPNELVRKFWILLDFKGKWHFANNCPNAYLEGIVTTKKPGIDDMRESVAEELCKRVDLAAANYERSYAYDGCIDLIIDEIRRIPQTSLDSGADSKYEDVWEEYAAYVQGIDSCFMQAHEHLVEEICYKIVERLTKENLRIIWEEIKALCAWCDEDTELDISVMQKALAGNLIKTIFEAAVDHEFTKEENDEVATDDETDNGFILKKPDYEAIQVAINVLRLFLSQGKLPEYHIDALRKAQCALERLPAITQGIYCDYGISYRKKDGKRNYIRYISFLISDSEFSITTGARTCDQISEGDRIWPRWRIPIGWFPIRSLGRELYELEDEICQCLEQGAEITVKDGLDS